MLKKSNFKKSQNRLEGLFPERTPAQTTAQAAQMAAQTAAQSATQAAQGMAQAAQGAMQAVQNALGMQQKPDVPNELCTKCDACGDMLFTDDLSQNKMVCPKCGYHFHLSAQKRIDLMCDAGSFTEWDRDVESVDPLNFPGYAQKLARGRLSGPDAREVLTGKAAIGKMPCAVFAMEPAFMMGSMGSAVGEKITRLFERAEAENLPVVGFTVSGGARMQEGILSLMQMAKTSGAVKRHSDAGLLYVTVLTDPTTGGVTASFAMEGDILLAEPGSLIAFAGPRVIEQTIRQKLPKGFQKAEFLLEKGFLDAVVPRNKLRGTLKYILRLHAGVQNPAEPAAEHTAGPPKPASKPAAKPAAKRAKATEE